MHAPNASAAEVVDVIIPVHIMMADF